jgi:hypothetical protein
MAALAHFITSRACMMFHIKKAIKLWEMGTKIEICILS